MNKPPWETLAAGILGVVAIICTAIGIGAAIVKECPACSTFWFHLAIILVLLTIGFLVHQLVQKRE